jgi:hypothetical protein
MVSLKASISWAIFGVLFCQGLTLEAKAEFRFSTQSALTAPDPFIKPKKKPVPRVAMLPPQSAGQLAQRPPFVWGQLDPRLLALIDKIGSHFGGKPLISSGCRTAAHNLEVGGAPHSFHLSCMAADISISGVSTAALRDYAMALPERGGVGTYCSTPIVHVDVGPRRQWYWGCQRSAISTSPVRNNSPFDLK